MDDNHRDQLIAPLIEMVGGKKVWFGSLIPPKKRDAAIRAYAPGVNPDRVIAFYDSTIFKTGDEGFLVTDAAFYCKEFYGTAAAIRFEHIEHGGEGDVAPTATEFVVRLKDGARVAFKCTPPSTPGAPDPAAPLRRFFDRVRALQAAGAFAVEDRFVIVQDMSEEFRVAYLRMAVFLALADDNEVDAGELAEIQLLMTRLGLSAAARRQVWRFLGAPTGSPKEVLGELEMLAPKGAWSVLALSLVKDLIGVSRRRRTNSDGAANPFVAWVAQQVSVNDQQLALIEQALAFDDALLSGKVKAKDLKAMGSALAAQAAAVGVPLVAIYLSGSVIGLGAAGMTSGLAALGLGGLFGLSSMVTGVGVVLVLGVGVYKLVRWMSGSEEKELAEFRERMMQDVVRQLQATVNALIEDLTLLTQDVVEITRDAEIDQVRLRRLAQEVNALTAALARLTKRQTQAPQALAVMSS